MQFGIHRMVCSDPISMEPSISTRLEALRLRQNAWRHCDLTSMTNSHLTSEDHLKVALCTSRKGILRMVHSETVSFIHLCSNSDRERPVFWNHSMGFPVRTYTADPAQDLMIIV